MVYLLVIAVAMTSLYLIFKRPTYVQKTDTLTFERVVDADEGRPLVPADLISKEGVRLTEVFSL